MNDLDVHFFRLPDLGHGEEAPLGTLRMTSPPRLGEFVLLPGEGLRWWLVERVLWDLRAARRAVTVWVSAT